MISATSEGSFEAVNEHGFPQMYEPDPSHPKGRYPVCSQNFCSGYINRGQGTACPSCRARIEADMAADQ